MPDDLRTRIAAVLRREVPCHPPAAGRIADALIAELGLKQQWLCQHREYNEPPVILSGNPLVQHRYVTDWIAND